MMHDYIGVIGWCLMIAVGGCLVWGGNKAGYEEGYRVGYQAALDREEEEES